MPYVSDGSLTTDSREVAIDTTWDTQTDWEAYQSINNVEITNGVLTLSETSVIDDFEDGDIAEYTGDTGGYEAQSSVVKEGSFALANTSTQSTVIQSHSGLPYYPVRGDTFRYWARVGGTDYHLMYFFAQDSTGSPPEGYAAYLDPGADVLILRKSSGGNTPMLDSAPVTLNTNTWYEVEVSTAAGGTLTVTLFDESGTQLQQVSASDSAFDSGGIAWETNGSSWADYVRLV